VNTPLPSDAQLDALREVANIGCGHAANALSRLMGGRQVDLSVPRVLVTDPEGASTLLGGDAPVVASWLGMTGELRGVLLLVLPTRDSVAMESLLLGGRDAGQEERDSMLMEVANIVASACLSAIGKLTGWRLMPTVPTLRRGSAHGVVDAAVSQVRGRVGPVVVLEARFSSSSAPEVGGQVLLVLERDSSHALLARLGV
jgi:chemotaxis protein CheC